MGGQQGAVGGERQAQRLGQAVHGVSGEHTRAGTAGGAGSAFNGANGFVRNSGIGGVHHGVNQIQFADLAVNVAFTRLHRPTRDKNGGNV